MTVPVLPWQLNSFGVPTTARERKPGNERLIVDDKLFPTDAAHPASAEGLPLWASIGWRFRKDEKPFKDAPDDVLFGRHNGYRLTVVASGGRPASTGAHCDLHKTLMEVN